MSIERNLRLALHQLVEAIEYTPMGVRGIKAMANARKALEAAQQPATPDLHIGVCITDGVLYATVMQHESNGATTVVATAEIDTASLHGRDCIGKMKPATGDPVAVQALEAIAKGDLGGMRYLESSEAMVIRMQSIAATAIKSIIHGSQGALKCTNGTQNTLPQQQEAGAVGDTKTPENGFQGPLAQDLSTKAGASQVEPFAHICIVNTKDAGPTKFFTAPSDPRAIPVYTRPAPSVPDDDFDLICNAIDKADTITMEGDYMLDSDDCTAVVRVMQVLLSVRAAMLAAKDSK